MTRAAIRALVERRLQQPVGGDRWSVAELNEAINLGYQAAQAKVLENNPEAFIYIDRADLVVDQHEYARPVGLISLLELSIKDAASGNYTPIDALDYAQIRRRATGSTSVDTCYAEFGRWWYIDPAPSASLADGLQAIYVPSLSLANDTSVPQIANLWHMVIVINAQLILLGETGDTGEKLVIERNLLYTQLGFVRKSAAPEAPLRPSIVRTYTNRGLTRGSR